MALVNKTETKNEILQAVDVYRRDERCCMYPHIKELASRLGWTFQQALTYANSQSK